MLIILSTRQSKYASMLQNEDVKFAKTGVHAGGGSTYIYIYVCKVTVYIFSQNIGFLKSARADHNSTHFLFNSFFSRNAEHHPYQRIIAKKKVEYRAMFRNQRYHGQIVHHFPNLNCWAVEWEDSLQNYHHRLA